MSASQRLVDQQTGILTNLEQIQARLNRLATAATKIEDPVLVEMIDDYFPSPTVLDSSRSMIDMGVSSIAASDYSSLLSSEVDYSRSTVDYSRSMQNPNPVKSVLAENRTVLKPALHEAVSTWKGLSQRQDKIIDDLQRLRTRVQSLEKKPQVQAVRSTKTITGEWDALTKRQEDILRDLYHLEKRQRPFLPQDTKQLSQRISYPLTKSSSIESKIESKSEVTNESMKDKAIWDTSRSEIDYSRSRTDSSRSMLRPATGLEIISQAPSKMGWEQLSDRQEDILQQLRTLDMRQRTFIGKQRKKVTQFDLTRSILSQTNSVLDVSGSILDTLSSRPQIHDIDHSRTILSPTSTLLDSSTSMLEPPQSTMIKRTISDESLVDRSRSVVDTSRSTLKSTLSTLTNDTSILSIKKTRERPSEGRLSLPPTELVASSRLMGRRLDVSTWRGLSQRQDKLIDDLQRLRTRVQSLEKKTDPWKSLAMRQEILLQQLTELDQRQQDFQEPISAEQNAQQSVKHFGTHARPVRHAQPPTKVINTWEQLTQHQELLLQELSQLEKRQHQFVSEQRSNRWDLSRSILHSFPSTLDSSSSVLDITKTYLVQRGVPVKSARSGERVAPRALSPKTSWDGLVERQQNLLKSLRLQSYEEVDTEKSKEAIAIREIKEKDFAAGKAKNGVVPECPDREDCYLIAILFPIGIIVSIVLISVGYSKHLLWFMYVTILPSIKFS